MITFVIITKITITNVTALYPYEQEPEEGRRLMIFERCPPANGHLKNGVVLEVDEIKSCDTLMYSDGEPGFRAYLPIEVSLPYIFENPTFRTDALTALPVF